MNLITYTAIILIFCKKEKLDDNIFHKVEDLGIAVDKFFYATLIGVVCRRRNLNCAFPLLGWEGEEKN